MKQTSYTLMSPHASDPRVNAFLTQYVQAPQTPEPGAACTSGTGCIGWLN
ncbi:hypothetical protein [Streptomyces erythrochromogenes]